MIALVRHVHGFSSCLNKRVIYLVFLMLVLDHLNAQEPVKGEGSLRGRIVDSLSRKPVEYASVGLLTSLGNKEVNGTTTDDKGEFILQGITPGTYRLVIYFVGYQTGYRNNIVVGKGPVQIALGDIQLSSLHTNLKAVTVTTEASLVEEHVDKMVYNAEKDLTSSGGSATDLLRKVPQVAVDIDGNVELQGNTNIRFLINGKPSTIFGNNLADVLQAIPASQIKSIEVITSPGAKYDAEGTGGIINIILKKSQAQGVNGSVSVSAGTRADNGSVNLNARKGAFGAHAYLSGSEQVKTTVTNSLNRTAQDPVTLQTTQLNQNGSGTTQRYSYQGGMSADWEISAHDNLTGAFSYNFFGNDNTGILNRQTLTNDASGNMLFNVNDILNSKSTFQGYSTDWDLNYKHNFKKEGQELDAMINQSQGNNYNQYQQGQQYLTADTLYKGSLGKNPGTDKETDIAINYTQPLPKEAVFETGAKAVLKDIVNNSDVYLLNTLTGNYDYNASQSLGFHYQRNVFSGYVSLSFNAWKFLDVKAGFRYEYTQDNANYSNSGQVNFNPYGAAVPSLSLGHRLKNNQNIRLSYSHRIDRPDYRDLNPFVIATDPQNINTGNVNLKPEQSDKLELNYSKSYEKGGSVNVALFARLNTQDIQPYTRYYTSYQVGDSVYHNVAVATRENIGHENNYGINIYGSVPVTSKINIRGNLSGFQRYIYTGLSTGGDISGFNYRVNMNGTYEILSTLAFEAFGNFNSARINAQGTMPAFTSYSFALRKQFFQKKGSIALTATNPFSETIEQKTNLTGQNFTVVSIREVPYRSFGINLTYKFGKLEFKKGKEPEENTPVEPSPNG